MSQDFITSTNETYKDYQASYFFKALKAENVKFDKKVITTKDGEILPMVLIDFLHPGTGELVHMDMFCRDNATEEDVKAFKDSKISDFVFRIGYWPMATESGTVLAPGKPKVIAYMSGKNLVKFNGGKREFAE